MNAQRDNLFPTPGNSNPARIAKSVVVVLLTIVGLLPVVIAARAGQYNSIAEDPISAFGLWGTFAIHMWIRPGRKESSITVLLAVAMRVGYDLLIGEHGYLGSAIIGFGPFLGVSSLLALAAGTIVLRGEARAIRGRTLAVCGLFFYIGVFLAFYISFARMALPRKLDLYLYAFDNSLGFQPSFTMGRLFRASRPLLLTEAMVYNSLGLAFAVIYAVHANYPLRVPVNILKLLIANPIAGFSLYFCYPATGPKYAFPSFPATPGLVHPAALLIQGVPNAMPSLHFGGALLIFWLSRPWRWLRIASGVYLAMTALATLGLGEHYLIDLVVAVPYALALLAFISDTGERRVPLVAGTLMVAFWLSFLHMNFFHPIASWVLVLGTVGACIALERRLALRMLAPQPSDSPFASVEHRATRAPVLQSTGV